MSLLNVRSTLAHSCHAEQEIYFEITIDVVN